MPITRPSSQQLSTQLKPLCLKTLTELHETRFFSGAESANYTALNFQLRTADYKIPSCFQGVPMEEVYT